MATAVEKQAVWWQQGAAAGEHRQRPTRSANNSSPLSTPWPLQLAAREEEPARQKVRSGPRGRLLVAVIGGGGEPPLLLPPSHQRAGGAAEPGGLRGQDRHVVAVRAVVEVDEGPPAAAAVGRRRRPRGLRGPPGVVQLRVRQVGCQQLERGARAEGGHLVAGPVHRGEAEAPREPHLVPRHLVCILPRLPLGGHLQPQGPDPRLGANGAANAVVVARVDHDL
mmetsp:Transcript_33409/g.55289  ORF Transcript_33409/g.55289 Transcript_33409/m.55289 type:complete len:223 (-) Transcript_33409:1674-2342(-)